MLFFFAQCVWLVRAELRSEFGCYPETSMQRQGRVAEGLAQWKTGRIAGAGFTLPASHSAEIAAQVPTQAPIQITDRHHSPIWYLVASAPVVFWPSQLDLSANPGYERIWLWLTRIPYLAFGLFLGASLWYVAHRLYGNTGGFIALIL